MGAPETTWTGFDNQIIGDSNGLRYTRQPRRIIRVSPEGSRQRVQHFEGGIIREIRVREGDHVEAGDALIVLAEVGAESEVGQLMSRLRSLAATEARLNAERLGHTTISFDHPVLAQRDEPEVRELLEQQVNQLATRNASDESQAAILTQRLAQLQQQIIGAQKQLTGVRRQNELIREEIVIVREMYRKGYERKSRLLALQRTEAELTGQEGELISRIARADEQIGETKLQIINIKVERKEEVDQQFADARPKRAEVEQQMRQSLDRLSRTIIVAPASGTVFDLRFKTPGGVVRPGEDVLNIVPDKDALIIDAKVSPNDIDDVQARQHAYVIFPSFPQRNLHRINARVRTISPDSFEEQQTGERYYAAKIEVDRAQLQTLDPEIRLTPGMPAQVFIPTAQRTVLEYLMQPLLLTLETSIREH